MHATTLSLLLLVLTAAATSTAANANQEGGGGGGRDINLSMIDIHNDLPSYSPRLYVLGTFQSTEARIDPGQSYNFVAGGTRERGFLIREDNVCAYITAFDPNVDLGHHAVLWSVRDDGVFHSWDRSEWQKKASWMPRGNCGQLPPVSSSHHRLLS